MTTFVLVHSPLVGPYTWAPVVVELRKRGFGAIAPALPDSRELSSPYWRGHAGAVVEALREVPGDEPLVLAAHSGAGMLLPAVWAMSGRPVAAYIFVDAGIPRDGMSRLDFFGVEEAAEFRAAAEDGLLPTWSEEDLREMIPDTETRRRFVGELRPLPLAVYEEPIPVFNGWPDAPSGYLQFSRTYDAPASEAREAGWAYRQLVGGHFHMLAEPSAVADALVGLIQEMEVLPPAVKKTQS
ncbi:MAG: alpha/beta hydrolase [Chloroflexia bacterium]